MGEAGPKLIDASLKAVLRRAWLSGFTVSSDFARQYAEHTAMAASLGFISTRIMKNVYSREWQITVAGLQWLQETEETDGQEHLS